LILEIGGSADDFIVIPVKSRAYQRIACGLPDISARVHKADFLRPPGVTKEGLDDSVKRGDRKFQKPGGFAFSWRRASG
jgi:hypothetical protein